MRLDSTPGTSTTWPDIPFAPWRQTCAALHLYTQIVGKYRLARTPWVNHILARDALRQRPWPHHLADPRRAGR